MKVKLFPFQQRARQNLRDCVEDASLSYKRRGISQVISFTAPTGAGKTIMAAALVESIYLGDENYSAQPDAIFIWLSDSPELNKQSCDKFYFNSDGVNHSQLVIIEDEKFSRKILDDGKIYFLNTQKLGKSSNLTKHSDSRQYTIWETLQNTISVKADKLYLIIDEAHRGMKGTSAGRATTIMQKFIKGSAEDGISPAPLVIGMSATPERFNALVAGTASTIHQVAVTADEVKASGLLKERIIVVHPDDTARNSISKDMAMLEAAADEWKSKCEHWQQYCREQHKKFFNPIFVVQVMNGTGDKISDTDLDECLKRISARTRINFEVGEVVHTFGDVGDLTIDTLRVIYREPSHISGDDRIKVVLFKENLSTGWDCPQAETMMSFRRATDATYIAQLLGRMIRTPLQSHIEVDDTLNDVRLYLPYFDKDTVQNIVKELQSSEGGNIPSDIIAESGGQKIFDTWTIKTEKNISASQQKNSPSNENNFIAEKISENPQPVVENFELTSEIKSEVEEFVAPVESSFDRAAVVKAVNETGLLTYRVRKTRSNDYLKSLLQTAQFLTHNLIYREAFDVVTEEIVDFIHDGIEELKESGEYESLKQKAKEFKLAAQIFDPFGKSVKKVVSQNLFVMTDTDLERQFRQADIKLKSCGIANSYLRKFCSEDAALEDCKIDVILFTADKNFLNRLEKFSKEHFHELNDKYRRKTAKLSEKAQREYKKIISDGDEVSEHNFILPETISVPHDPEGKEYSDHLFVDEVTGTARIKLNSWEEEILREEERRNDFVCWLRNPARQSWALCIPYQAEDNETHEMYPDFLIVRREDDYIVDILEPHDPDRRDNIGKARGLAKYAAKNSGAGRLQLIRKNSKGEFKRLDMSKGLIREKISHASTNNELDGIFEDFS